MQHLTSNQREEDVADEKIRRRPRLTEAEKVMMWSRWQQGDSLHAIARLLDTTHTSVRRHLVATGGIQPPQRRRSKLALTLPGQ
jgi:hypothetical protein